MARTAQEVLEFDKLRELLRSGKRLLLASGIIRPRSDPRLKNLDVSNVVSEF